MSSGEESVPGKYGRRSWHNGADYRRHQIKISPHSANSHGYGPQKPTEDEKLQDVIDQAWAACGGEELCDRVEYQLQEWDVMEAML